MCMWVHNYIECAVTVLIRTQSNKKSDKHLRETGGVGQDHVHIILGWWLLMQIYGLLLGTVLSYWKQIFHSFWFKATELLHAFIVSWAKLSAFVFYLVFLVADSTRVGQISWRRSAWPVNLLPSSIGHWCLSGYSRDFGDQLVRFCSSALLVRILYVWLLESLLPYAYKHYYYNSDFIILVAMKNQLRLVLCIHNIHA